MTHPHAHSSLVPRPSSLLVLTSALRPHPSSLLLGLLAMLLTACATAPKSSAPAKTYPDFAQPTLPGPDWRARILPAEFKDAGDGEWIGPERTAAFPFDEMIYSWDASVPERQGFRLYMRVGFAPGDASPWLYGGYWGEVKNPITERQNPEFADGRVELDDLILKRKATTYQFKFVDEGSEPLARIPALYVVGTDRAQVKPVAPETRVASAGTPILDLPLRKQIASTGERMPNRCQSAATATALEYFGDSQPLEKIVNYCWDPEYAYPGIWPRTIAASTQLGHHAYIDRFRDWNAVRKTLEMNRVILTSIRVPKGDYIAPAYPELGGHIVALNGITNDGRVIVTDSFGGLGDNNEGYRLQWYMEDFEKIWMQVKGGVGLVVCPPEGATLKAIPPAEIPPFPANRKKG